MTSSNATLTSLWVDDATPLKVISVARTPNSGTELREDALKYYKDSGLEPVAKEAGVLDGNGELAASRDNSLPKGAVQMIALPVASPGKSPFKVEQQILPRQIGTPTHQTVVNPGAPMILGTQQRIISSHVVTQSPRGAQMIATPILESPQQWSTGARKRPHELDEFTDGKRGKKGEKGGKGLRHFSMKVCEKVQKKGLTSYNEVADELVGEFSDPRNMTPSDQVSHAYDQKNIRRRVYDALNVLMAMNIISKEKKEIRWIGLPTNSAQECQNLELEKQRRMDRIKHKTQQLQELIIQQIAFKNLVQRNRELELTQGTPTANSSIQLPFIIVNTGKKTVIDCSISNDKYEYLFNFDNTFEIHDDIEVLKRMGMAHGLERGQCSSLDVKKAIRMVPKALEPYVLDLANVAQTGMTTTAASASGSSQYRPQGHLANPSLLTLDQSADAEVALATSHGLSRQSSIGSFSDVAASRESPSEPYSDDESDSGRSSPVEIS